MSKKTFINGFVLGVILKDRLVNTLKSIIFNSIDFAYKIKNRNALTKTIHQDKISHMYLLFEITNEDLFNQTFCNIFQPGWKYFHHKKVLKIQLEDEIVDYLNTFFIKNDSISINDFYELKDDKDDNVLTLDIPLFEVFSDISLFVEYYYSNQKFINVYTNDIDILKSDFIKSECPLFQDILCSSIKIKNKNEYITSYLKLFVNNKRTVLTPELLLLNYDKIDFDLKQIKQVMIANKNISTYSYNDQIN